MFLRYYDSLNSFRIYYYYSSVLAAPGSTSATLMFEITLWFLHSVCIGLIIRFQNNGIAVYCLYVLRNGKFSQLQVLVCLYFFLHHLYVLVNNY